ncbi:TIGR02679 domain-containing protein [Peptostreptococcus stomatis]|uniref:TIGR02679 domain-containing protein n=1 Tax=Peptostreptococcus stomatis TaxID=341694 RepID=UPI0039966D9B
MGRKVSRKSAINYYKNSSAYRKMCKDLMMKYKRYGRLTGRISLKDYTDKQKIKIADFVGESVADLGSKNDVSVAKIKSAHLDTKYGDYDLAYLASEVTGIGLSVDSDGSKPSKEAIKETIRDEIRQLLSAVRSDVLDEIMDKIYYENKYKEISLGDIYFLGNAIEKINQRAGQFDGVNFDNYIYLAVFAAEITSNPYEFDEGTVLGDWLFRILALTYGDKPVGMSYMEYRDRVFEHYGILLDDIFHFLSVNHMLARSNGEVNSVWSASCRNQVSWKAPLKHILKMDLIYPELGDALILVENASVFYILSAMFNSLPIVCFHGKLRKSIWTFMDKLSKDAKVYYAGDFDPEGLKMADDIKQAYGDMIDLSLMRMKYYEGSKPRTKIKPANLDILDKIRDEKLKEVAKAIKDTKLVGHQYNLIEMYVEHIFYRIINDL